MNRPFERFSGWMGEEDLRNLIRFDKDYLRTEELLFSLRLMAAMPTG